MFRYVKVRRSDGVVIKKVEGGSQRPLPRDDDTYYHMAVPDGVNIRGAMKVVEGSFVDCSPKELATVGSLKALRHRELVSTDFIFGGDSPFTEEQKAVWMEYRKALRDITDDGETVDKMVSRFPVRPDGKDPIKDLR